jgi:hypothetical protein
MTKLRNDAALCIPEIKAECKQKSENKNRTEIPIDQEVDNSRCSLCPAVLSQAA